jgi:hypothetical protein
MDSEDIVRKFHQKRGRIRDPEKIHPRSGSRIQGVKKHRIPDPRIRNTALIIQSKLPGSDIQYTDNSLQSSGKFFP